MKKILPLILAAALMLSLAACGGETENSDNDADTQYYNIGDTVSTDIVDFTLNNCDLSIFADPNTALSLGQRRGNHFAQNDRIYQRRTGNPKR